jgi:trimeric autotransporter adhesin
MSTKTTFKRVALVAVAALGLGVVTSVAPATAAPLTPTLVTVGTVPVAQVGVTHKTPITFTIPTPTTAGTDTHTVTVRIISAPAGSVYAGTLGTAKVIAGTVGLSWIDSTVYAGAGGTTVAGDIDISSTGTASTAGTVGTEVTGTTRPEVAATLTTGASTTTTTLATVDIMPDVAGTYTVLVSTSPRAEAVATSTYAAGDASATYSFSTGAAVASVTLAAVTGSPVGGSTNGQIYKVTIKDAAGGVTQLASGEAINLTSNVATTNFGEIAPCTSSCSASYNGAGVTAGLDSSNFSAGVAYIAIKDATAAAADAVITATGSGLLSNTITGTVAFSTVLGTTFATSAIADVALAVRPGSGKKGVTEVTAGSSYTDKVSTAVTSHSYAVTVATAPTAAKNVAVNITDTDGKITGLKGAVYSTYVGVAATTGLGTLTVTSAAMSNGNAFTASVASTTAAAIVVTAETASSAASTIAVEPNSVIKAAFGASSVLSAVLKDQFGAAVANHVVTVSTTGRNASTSNTTLATDADGRVTFTRTDAGTSATTNKQSVVTFAPTSGTSATVTINYVDSGLGVATVALETPTSDDTAATGVTYSDINASSTAGAYTAATAQTITATVTDVNGTLLVGIPVTFSTASAGAAVVSTSATVYTGADGTAAASVYGWTAGEKTFTATVGTKSATGTVAYRQGGATGTNSPTEVRTISAVATGNKIVVTAKDRFGNVVQGVALFATRTGNGTFGGGSNTNGQTTGVDGTAEFLFNAGSEDSVVTITASDSTTALPSVSYGQTGYLAGMNVRSTAATQTAYTASTVGTATTAETGVGASFAAAGVGSVTVAVAAGTDTAQVAADAAAEATDAANAATDAANAAAEAADAATAAAQDAADAVAALSTQVSEMVNALKKQITALTNLVIKIQKKVKA